MSKHPLLLGLTLLSASLFTGQTFADRTVTDQLGRQVTLPDHVTRVVVLQHQTLNLLVQLHAAEDIVGVLSSWKKQLGPQFARFMPEIGQLATPGDLTQVNIESLLALRPQVVFVANYAPPAMIAQIQQAGIPVVAISLRHDAAGEKNKMNPTMADEEQAYNAGLMEGIRLIGEVVERQPEAEALIHYTFEARKQANAPVADIPPNQRVRVYMANPDLNTYGAGKYTGLMMAHAGALNVAAASVKGARQVSLEQVLEWNPPGDLRPGPLSAGGQTDRERPAVAGDRCGETSPRVADAGVCQSLGLPDAGGPGAGRAVDGEKTLSSALPEHRCGQ
ncbi:putative ABC transport system periplasmic binding component [Klebsiella pneumoniae]|nr:putative ABC transport system periplasmic binding component [Klebsiella pneumoniae]